MTRFILAFAAFALAGTAVAQTEQPRERTDENEMHQAHQAQQGGEEKNERLICRRLSPAATGSAMGHRRCLTAAQWRALNRAR
jgi:hypothetical protein